jgi:hypothetical protein
MARRLALLIWLAAGLTPAAAETSIPAAVPQVELSLQGFAAKNSACLEWTDGCATCRRDSGGAHCSTPGIACQPVEIVCKAPP